MRASSTSSTSTTSTTSSTTSSTSSSRRRGRKGLKAWLLEQVDCGRYPGLRWEEGAGRQLFRLPWKHASKHDYTHADSALFRAWAEHKGRFRAGVDKPDPPGWKTRLRCAMNKSRDFVEEPNRGQADISHPYKVYRVLSQRSAPPPTPAVVSSPCGSLDSHEEDKDTDNGRPRPARMPLYALMGLEEASNRKIEADAMDTNDDVASPPMIGGSAEDPANIDQLEEELGPKASAFRVTVSYRGRQLLCCTVTNSSGCLITSHSACGREPTNGSAALESPARTATRGGSRARRRPATGRRPPIGRPRRPMAPLLTLRAPSRTSRRRRCLLRRCRCCCRRRPTTAPATPPVVVAAANAAAVNVAVALAAAAAAVPPPWHCRPRRHSWTLGTGKRRPSSCPRWHAEWSSASSLAGSTTTTTTTATTAATTAAAAAQNDATTSATCATFVATRGDMRWTLRAAMAVSVMGAMRVVMEAVMGSVSGAVVRGCTCAGCAGPGCSPTPGRH
uniref:Interferon regulatory factor-like protein 5 n=1 Tax=Lethenteron camtschaticum TaxID=980415 RepID=A0A9Y1M1R8_LETCA|nr:interferon regulatory factor-like protein 5 [Lethenteron camtschaticum]